MKKEVKDLLALIANEFRVYRMLKLFRKVDKLLSNPVVNPIELRALIQKAITEHTKDDLFVIDGIAGKVDRWLDKKGIRLHLEPTWNIATFATTSYTAQVLVKGEITNKYECQTLNYNLEMLKLALTVI